MEFKGTELDGWNHTEKKQLRNAFLNSKAPEMLELLKDIYHGSDGNDINYWKDKIEQLIKEVTNI